MTLFYRIIFRRSFHRLAQCCPSIDIRQSLTTLCLFLLLSFTTTIIVNILIPHLLIKISSPPLSSISSPSSSLSLLTSSHVFFPAGVTSVQCSSAKKNELQAQHRQRQPSNTERKYTKDQIKEKNVSSGKFSLVFF